MTDPVAAEEEAWHDMAAMLSRAVRAHAEGLTAARVAAGMDVPEAIASVRRYGERLAGAVRNAADEGAREVAA